MRTKKIVDANTGATLVITEDTVLPVCPLPDGGNFYEHSFRAFVDREVCYCGLLRLTVTKTGDIGLRPNKPLRMY